MRKFGLIGYPLSHSFSPKYFNDKFLTEGISDAEYQLYPIGNADDLKLFLTMDLCGFNVTIPYKKSILPLLDELHEDVLVIGSVNCVKNVNGKWMGYNTDWLGFKESLIKFLGGEIIHKALVFGTGGSSAAVAFAMQKMGIVYDTVSSSGKGDFSYAELSKEIISEHNLLINTTPLGMSPNVSTCPDLPYEALEGKHFLFDLVYNPEKSLFLTYGEQQGARIKNGYEMLVLQAEHAWKIWNKN
jgi:shikimate dehydrogenase